MAPPTWSRLLLVTRFSPSSWASGCWLAPEAKVRGALMDPRHRICVQLICLPSVLHVGAIISRPSPRVLQSVRRRSQKRKTNEEDNPAVGRLLEPPSPDLLNTLSPTPPLEMAGPPLRLQPRHWLRPPSHSHLVPGSRAQPGHSTPAGEDVLLSRRNPHGELPRHPTFSLATGRPYAIDTLRRLRAAGRNSPSSQPQWMRTCCRAIGTPMGSCRAVQPSALPRGDRAPSLHCAGCVPPAATAPRVNRSGRTGETRLKIRLQTFSKNPLKAKQIRSKTCFSKVLHKTPSKSASTSILAKQTYYLAKIDTST
jgi:hypothetical protein